MISQTIAPLGRFIHVRSALKAEEAILYMLGHLPPDTSSILTATKTVPKFKLLTQDLTCFHDVFISGKSNAMLTRGQWMHRRLMQLFKAGRGRGLKTSDLRERSKKINKRGEVSHGPDGFAAIDVSLPTQIASSFSRRRVMRSSPLPASPRSLARTLHKIKSREGATIYCTERAFVCAVRRSNSERELLLFL